uniref:L-Fucosyltransferase n=1 Tax=Homo sapiens TaxID=9606 RepID=A0A977TNB7_HUMAN|nr:fucosyltransferase [Homo sapiens]
MWLRSHRQLCLAFLLVCVLSVIFFLHIHQDSFPHGLGLSILCPDRRLVTPPVAIFCLPGTAMGPNASSSCPQHPASLSGTWTVYPNGRFGNQMGQYATLLALAQLNGRRAFILPAMHAALAPVFRITLPVLAPEVDSRTPWRELQLHDWMSEEYADLRDPFLKLSGSPALGLSSTISGNRSAESSPCTTTFGKRRRVCWVSSAWAAQGTARAPLSASTCAVGTICRLCLSAGRVWWATAPTSGRPWTGSGHGTKPPFSWSPATAWSGVKKTSTPPRAM